MNKINGLPKDYEYKPIPHYLELKSSDIDGYGIFAKEDINRLENDGWMSDDIAYNVLCETHIVLHNKIYSKKYLYRTPVGGFINHSNTPNATLIKIYPESTLYNNNLIVYALSLLRDVKAGEEITLDYNKELCGIIK